MKQSLLVLSMLGALAWAVEAVSLLLPSLQPQPLLVELNVPGAGAVLGFGLPVLALVVGILGSVSAGRRQASAWATGFAILAVLAVVLPVVGLFLMLLFVFSYDRTLEAVGQVAADIGLLFPVLVFVAALLYVVRAPLQVGKGQLQP